MKYLLIIGDGMADDPVPALGGRTPLEAADKPVIDELARRGQLGSAVNCPAEFEPGSATAIMSIFGASPREYYHGRGPLEAAAQGIELADGDMACRCNMITLEDADKPYASPTAPVPSTARAPTRSSPSCGPARSFPPWPRSTTSRSIPAPPSATSPSCTARTSAASA